MEWLSAYCFRLTGRREEADDLRQDVILKAMRNHHAFDPGRPIRPWLKAIARNQMQDVRRSAWVRRVLGYSHVGASSIEVSPPASADDERERDIVIRIALLTLPDLYREALNLYYLEERSYTEMNALTGVEVSALKQRVRRGGAMLKTVLERKYATLTCELG
jgi:RNA polymerase sigma-70 factor (ECF subfamily)